MFYVKQGAGCIEPSNKQDGQVQYCPQKKGPAGMMDQKRDCWTMDQRRTCWIMHQKRTCWDDGSEENLLG
jgi:hypothetical protein